MNIKEIKEMINLMNENGLTELEIEKEGLRILLKKGSSGEMVLERFPAKAATAPSLPPETIVYQTPPVNGRGAEKTPAAKGTLDIKAPMVGTFYRAPSPESPAFAEIGQTIEVGQVVCIIEAMKLMNEIKAEIKGKIVDILVDNAEPVEFGQPLFLIETA